jgi:hypothetical protein
MTREQPTVTLDDGPAPPSPLLRRELLVVLLAAFAVPLAFCPSLLTSPASGLADGRPFATSHFWIADHLWAHWMQGKILPGTSTILTHPTLLEVRYIGWPLILLGFVFRLVMPSIAAFNLAFVVLMAAGSMAAFALARRLTGATWPSAVAGLLFGNSAYVLTTVYNGHVYSMFVCWIPLALLLAHRALATGRYRDYIGLLLVSATAVLDNPYHGAVAMGWICLFALLHAIRPATRARALRAGLVVVVMLVGSAAPVPYFVTDLNRDVEHFVHLGVAVPGPDCGAALEARVGKEEAARAMEGVYRQALDPVSLVLPGRAPASNPSEGLVESTAHNLVRDPIHTVYFGIPFLLLALVPLIRRRRWTASTGLLLVGSGIFFVAALGPSLILNGEQVCVQGRPIWLPYAVALRFLSFLWDMGGIYRWSVGASLGLGLLGAVGLIEIQRLLRPPWGRVATAGIGLLILADFVFLGPTPLPLRELPMERPPCMEWLRQRDPRGAVVELADWVPVGYETRVNLKPLSYLRQWQHGHPVARRFDAFQRHTPGTPPRPDTRRLGLPEPLVAPSIAPETVAHLQGAGIGWLLVSGAASYETDSAAFEPIVQVLGRPGCTCADGAGGFMAVFEMRLPGSGAQPPSQTE